MMLLIELSRAVELLGSTILPNEHRVHCKCAINECVYSQRGIELSLLDYCWVFLLMIMSLYQVRS